jgi:hypothetical protein
VFRLKVDANDWLHANETAKGERRWVDPAAGRERFGEWAERWYATTAALRPTTRRDYRVLLGSQVLPAFATARLADLDALAVREWLACRLEWGGVKTHEARTVRLPRFSATSWAPTSRAGPTAPRTWCSRRRWAGHCASPSSSPAT